MIAYKKLLSFLIVIMVLLIGGTIIIRNNYLSDNIIENQEEDSSFNRSIHEMKVDSKEENSLELDELKMENTNITIKAVKKVKNTEFIIWINDYQMLVYRENTNLNKYGLSVGVFDLKTNDYYQLSDENENVIDASYLKDEMKIVYSVKNDKNELEYLTIRTLDGKLIKNITNLSSYDLKQYGIRNNKILTSFNGNGVVIIDLDGKQTIYRDISKENIWNIVIEQGKIYYLSNENKSILKVYDIKNRKTTEIADYVFYIKKYDGNIVYEIQRGFFEGDYINYNNTKYALDDNLNSIKVESIDTEPKSTQKSMFMIQDFLDIKSKRLKFLWIDMNIGNNIKMEKLDYIDFDLSEFIDENEYLIELLNNDKFRLIKSREIGNVLISECKKISNENFVGVVSYRSYYKIKKNNKINYDDNLVNTLVIELNHNKK